MPARFHIAFSFAGAQRSLVAAVAAEAERRLGFSTVFYDDWFEHEIAGRNADLLLQRLYGERCDLVVVCVSADYDDRPWTRLEHEAVRARYQRATSEQERKGVLLIRVGPGDVEGILPNAIVPDVRERPPSAISDLIVDRLNAVSPGLLLPTDLSPEWPSHPPTLRWALANHNEVRRAFAEFITFESPFQLLFVEGPAETGKTTISRQMHAAGYNMPRLRCGRLDLKGTAGLDRQVDLLCLALDICEPPPAPLGARLRSLQEELSRVPQPTLLVLDTYEDAGEAAEWVEERLLVALKRMPWLRIVILGQHVPRAANTPWERLAQERLVLATPTAHDWFDFGREYHPDADDLTLDEVLLAHRLTHGKPALMAQILRPS
jgi:hypothetical protein